MIGALGGLGGRTGLGSADPVGSDDARIASVAFERRRVPLVVPFAITGSRQEEADCVYVRVVDDAGRTGWGEASPLPVVTGDTVEGALAFLGALGPSFRGSFPGEAAVKVRGELRTRFGDTQTSALCGIESALYDLLARQYRVPLHALFDVGRLESVVTDITVPALAPAELPAFWAHFAGHGFSTFKVKVTGDGLEADLARSLDAWEHLPPGGALVLDGNQGFTADSARTLLARVADAGARVAFFEQPLARGDHGGLAELVATSETPVCLDESVRSVADLVGILGALPGAARARLLVNLKIMKAGVHETFLVGSLARRLGLGLMMGGMMETDLAMACSLHLCAALGGVEACDLDTPFYLVAMQCEGSPWAEGRSTLRLPVGEGLGVAPA